MRYHFTPPTVQHKEERQDEAPVAVAAYGMYEHTYSARHLHFYISDAIGAPNQYIDMIHRISTASEQDVISIHLNTTGGRADTGIQIINAIRNSEAKIITILDGIVQSLGTLIFLSGDELVTNENCMMMFHNFSGGTVGKGNEMVAELAATIKWFQTLTKDIYVPFLTVEELSRITNGEDLWMMTSEINERLERMQKVREGVVDAPAEKAPKVRTRTKSPA